MNAGALDHETIGQLATEIAALVNPPTPRLVNADQAAELLAVPPSWLLAEARADRVPHVRLGRYVRFAPVELEQWWRDRLQGPRR